MKQGLLRNQEIKNLETLGIKSNYTFSFPSTFQIKTRNDSKKFLCPFD